MHTLAAVCAVCAEYLPGEQLLHCESATAPCALEYFPLPHGLHVSVVCSSVSPYLPATHAVHDAWPFSCWNRPLSHLVHVVSPLPEYRPSVHVSHLLPDALLTSFCPGKHATHTDDPASEALPVTHDVHSESPPSAVYVPALQLMHTLAAV